MAELHCAKSIAELADLWCRMDAHEGQAAWAGAVGTVAAVGLTGLLALGAWRGELERRRMQSRVAAMVAARLASIFYAGLERIRLETGGPRAEITPTLAKKFQTYGLIQELAGSFDDVRAIDLPSPTAFRAYTSLRTQVRAFLGLLDHIAESGVSRAVDLGTFQARAMDLRKTLEKQERRYLRKRSPAYWYRKLVSDPLQQYLDSRARQKHGAPRS